jgi:hypothetical protein
MAITIENVNDRRIALGIVPFSDYGATINITGKTI